MLSVRSLSVCLSVCDVVQGIVAHGSRWNLAWR